MPNQEPINAAAVVDDVLTRFPTTAAVFVRRRMHCVGCEVSRFETLAGAARIYGQSLESLLAELRSVAASDSSAILPSLRQRKDAPLART